MFRTYLRSGLSLALVAMASTGLLAAWNMPGSSSRDQEGVTFKATGSTSNEANPNCNGKSNTSCKGNAPAKEFGLTVGSTGPLYPGLSNDLPVTFSNPQAFDIKVTTLTVSIERLASNLSCDVQNLVFPSGVTNLTPSVVVPRKATAATTVTVGLKPSANQACERAGFNITVTATAVMN